MLIKDKHCLEAIQEAIDRIQEYTADYDNADDFNENYRNFDACMMNFIVIGEMVEKLSSDFKDTHPHVDWKKIKGFRNIVAHDYFGIDAEEVWQIILGRLPALKSDILKMLNV
jgi:uncharacterized protein with HEPN domain